MKILIEKFKNKIAEMHAEGMPDNIIINTLREELQYPVLDFIYNNRDYSHLIMYGGTLLRIGYGLSRMSEDLDFQTDKKFNFKKFEKDLISYFKNTYQIDINIKTKTERLTGTENTYISFPNILEEVGIKGHGIWKILKIRIDINHFSKASNFTTETIPVSRDTYAFSIKTYPLSTLMASKIAAVLLRTKRDIGKGTANCKPRDIYDLMWYMEQKAIPNIEYLKGIYIRAGVKIKIQTILDVFDMIMRRVTNLDDKLFRNDLSQFFYHSHEYDDWHRNWRQRIRILRDSYEIYEINKIKGKPDLKQIKIIKDFSSDNRHFHFYFSTIEPQNKTIRFICSLSEYWYLFSDFQIHTGYRKKEIEDFIQGKQKLKELDFKYMGLFYTKIEDYIKYNNYIVLKPELKTKLIRATTDKLNVKKQIFLNRRLLIKEKFEDLL